MVVTKLSLVLSYQNVVTKLSTTKLSLLLGCQIFLTKLTITKLSVIRLYKYR